MPNDTAITRLLYAILSQKCLKDIDWNKVAHDPILSQEITNGHAARMRYSRFKKQMDGTAATRRPRAPNSPRKKVEKSSPKSRKGKGKKEEAEDEGEGVKPEPEMVSRQGTVDSEERMAEGRKRVKREPGLAHPSSLSMSKNMNAESLPTPRTMPNTPSSSRYMREESASPSPGPSERFEMGEMDEMGFSFGMQEGLPGMYGSPPIVGGMGEAQGFGGAGGYGMGMNVGGQMGIGMGDPFEVLWGGDGDGHHGHANGARGAAMHGGSGMHGESGVHVKTEPRWEEAYRHA